LQHLPKVANFFATLGIPAPAFAAVAISWLELIGGIGLALGLGSRFWELLLAGDMFVAYLPAGRQNLLAKATFFREECDTLNEPIQLNIHSAQQKRRAFRISSSLPRVLLLIRASDLALQTHVDRYGTVDMPLHRPLIVVRLSFSDHRTGRLGSPWQWFLATNARPLVAS
jgi:hypothetical protein